MDPVWKFLLLLAVCGSHSVTGDSALPVGHLQPLGGHRPPDVPIDELHTIPHPREFWDKYVKHEKAVILRGAAKNSPAFTLWTEEYLRDNYGKLEVRLEGKREKNGPSPIGAKGIIGRDTIGHFIETYQNKDAYLVSQLPTDMYHEVLVQPCLTCGSFRKNLVEIDLWMSSNGGSSVLHKDAFNSMNCLYNGTKHWKLIERKYEPLLHKAWEPSREVGGYSEVNVHKVDLLKHPNMAKVHWSNFTINAGDCLYLPKSYWHQVESVGDVNLAVAILFARLEEFDDSDCDTQKVEYTPLSELEVMWNWAGYGNMTMGHADLEESIRSLLQEKTDEVDGGTGKLTKDDLFNDLKLQMPEYDDDVLMMKAERAFAALDVNSKGYLDSDDVEALDWDTLRVFTLEFENQEPSNTELYEYSYIYAHEIMSTIVKLAKKDGELTRSDFIHAYTTELWGSEKFGTEIFDRLVEGQDHDEDVVQDLTVGKIEYALENWIIRIKPEMTPEMDEEYQEKTKEREDNSGVLNVVGDAEVHTEL
ncbi:KDM8 [Branchiostoma lanceolatum]|uniref:KDM8 protein n=1 Tax=Branchiostoma lanceolatum TaxID=7740 RepID=A0A8K0E8J3_BRALA|nr:KDM8 [Branchiostoma lanceolatum]